MKKIIIDTDPGVDDALAILLAISSDLNITGIITTYGNSDIQNTTNNTLNILQILKSNIPVFQGASNPILKEPILATSHGSNGLGEFNQKTLLQIEKRSAIQFLIDSLSQNQSKNFDIICLGPTTNLALLKIIRPDLIPKINQIIILGGVFDQKGNITSVAEFNVFNDPLALKIVLTYDTKITLIPINICRQVTFTQDEFNQLINPNISDSFKKIANSYITYYQSDQKYGGFSGGVMYDLLAISYLINQNLFKTEGKFVSVNPTGQTLIQSKQNYNCQLVTKADSVNIKKLFFNSVNKKFN